MMSDTISRKRDSTIRRARLRAGVGVRQLARKLDVTPKAVTDWEKSEEQGTVQLNTIQRALDALGEQIVIGSRRRTSHNSEQMLERREERVALELHRAVAKKLIGDPETVLRVIPGNIDRLRGQVRGDSADSWLDEWSELAQAGSLGGLVDVMLGTDQRSINMRQSSPFLGVLTQPERLAAIDLARPR
jgi:transcriptional regulator with XRE-family HTH domain